MEKKLKRDPQEKMIAGVAGGIAKYFELDVTFVRIAFALAAFFGGSGIWIYIILWIAVPYEVQSPYTYTDYRAEPEQPITSEDKKNRSSKLNFLLGTLLIVMGAYFLLGEFDLLPYWFSVKKLWPLILIAFGLLILGKTRKTKEPIDSFEDKKTTEDDFKNTTDEPYNQ